MSYENYTADIQEQVLNQKIISEKKVAKWKKTGLLEGLRGHRRNHMARLLENQASQVLREASTTADIKGFQAIAFPMVRRVFGQLLAQEIVSVQPMALPSGLIFWLDFKFATDKAGAGADWKAGRSVYGDPISPLTGGADATGGHYYLNNSYTQKEATGTVGVASSASVTSWLDVDYDLELSSAVAGGTLFKLTVDLDEDATITNIDDTNVQSFAVSASTVDPASIIRRHTSYNSATKVLTLFYTGTAGTAGGGVDSGSAVTVSYVKKSVHGADTTGTTLNPVFEYNYDDSDEIPELDIHVASHPIVANGRKLKVKWTPEMAQDMMAYQAVDAEAELTQIMADQVAMDIDSEILQHLVKTTKAHSEVLYWDARPGFYVNKDDGSEMSGPTFTGNVEEWWRTLMITINDASNRIKRRNLRFGANFIVAGTDVCTIFESLVQFRPAMDHADPSVMKFSMGVEKVGSLTNKYTVYCAAHFYRNIILLGYKGDEWLSTGYVYAPYVPLIATPTIYEPTNLTPTKGVMTRYAKMSVRPDMYALVVVKGLEIF